MTAVSSIESLLAQAETELAPGGFDNARLEAEALLSGLLNVKRTDLFLRRADPVDAHLADHFNAAVARRKEREPVAYILGNAVFSDMEFQVDERVLIPRPETELLVDEATALAAQRKESAPAILEIGTGSGCIAVALAKRIKNAMIVAVDLSPRALAVAQNNAKRLGVAGRIQFLQSDVYDALSREKRGYFDIIVSNPPYVSTSELESLETDVTYEPRTALHGGPDGLSVIDRIVAGAAEWLRPSGALLLEIGASQGMVVAERLSERAFLNVSVKPDLNGHHRVVTGVLGGPI